VSQLKHNLLHYAIATVKSAMTFTQKEKVAKLLLLPFLCLCYTFSVLHLIQNLVVTRDGNSTRGYGYPRLSDPTGKGMGSMCHPWVRVRAQNITRRHDTCRKSHPRALPVPASKCI
jgi:hypothetical protein